MERVDCGKTPVESAEAVTERHRGEQRGRPGQHGRWQVAGLLKMSRGLPMMGSLG